MPIRVALATAAILAAVPALAAQLGTIRPDVTTIGCADRGDARQAEELRTKLGISAALAFSVPRGCVSLLPEQTVTVIEQHADAMSLVVPKGQTRRVWVPRDGVSIR